MKVKLCMHIGHTQENMWLRVGGVVLTAIPEMWLTSSYIDFQTHFPRTAIALSQFTLGNPYLATTY